MYSTTDSDWLSYFQIAGIHGQPYIQWNNTGKQVGDGWLGYCPHGVSDSHPGSMKDEDKEGNEKEPSSSNRWYVCVCALRNKSSPHGIART